MPPTAPTSAWHAGSSRWRAEVSHECPGDGVRCDWCDRPGQPYEYRGLTFSGLTACEGDQLCRPCRDSYLDQKANRPVGWAQVPARDYVTPIAARYRPEYNDLFDRPRTRRPKL